MMPKYTLLLVTAVASTITLAMTMPVLADEHGAAAGTADQGVKLEEVVVTAQKRQEYLHDVPASIEVVSPEVLTNTNVESAQDLSRLVPGFAVDSQKSLFTTIFLRGIGTVQNGYSVEPSVGTVVDGVVQSRAGSSVYSDYEDIERIEVLRGPQGTLFGKNSSAGIINIVTKDPTENLTLNLGGSYGSYHENKFNGALSGALIDNTLLGRVSFVIDNRNGYVHNIYDGEDVNASHQTGVRTKLLYTPQEGTRLLLSADYSDLHHTCCVSIVLAITPNANLAERGQLPALFPGYPPGFLSDTNDQIDAQGRAKTNNKSKGVSLQWDQTIGSFTLTSIAAYRIWNAFSDDALLVNKTPVVFARFFYSTIDQHQASEELRIASPTGGLVDYLAGLFFLRDSISDGENWSLDFAPLIGSAPGVVVAPVNFGSLTSSKNYAAFGEANVHVTNKVTLIAGARETHERVDFNLGGSLFGGAIPMGAIDSASTNNLSWRGGVRWQINPDHTTYLTVSRGFKGPAFNGNSTILGNSQKVNPEVATSYEIGWKADFLEKRVRSNLAMFLTNLDQFQVQGYVVDPRTNLGVQYLTNANQLRSDGVELDVESAPMRNLSVNLNAAYINARYTDFQNAPCYTGQTTLAQGCGTGVNGLGQNLNGVAIADTPKFSFNVNGNYDIAVQSAPFDAFVRADYSWKSKVRWDPLNDPRTVEGVYGVLGGAVGIQSKDRKYVATAYGRNLTNKYHTNQIPNTDGVIVAILSPDYRRTWGISFSYQY